MRRFVVFLVLAVGFMRPAPAGAQLMQVIRELQEAYNRGNEIYELFHDLDGMIRDAEGGKKPDAHSERYRNVVTRIDAVAEQIRKYDYASGVDPSKYPVSYSEFDHCDTRPGANAKIQGYLETLRAAGKQGETLDAEIDGAISVNRQTQDIVLEVMKKAEKLTGNPFLSELNWLWWDLNKVQTSLTGIGNALADRRKQLQAERGKISTMASNLQSNFAGLQTVECSIGGNWDGEYPYSVQAGSGPVVHGIGHMHIHITRKNGVYECSMNLGVSPFPCRSITVSIKDRSVELVAPSIGVAGLDYGFKATIASDYRSMTGERFEVWQGRRSAKPQTLTKK